LRINPHGRSGFAIEDRVEHDCRGFPAEGKNAGGHFIEHYAKREDVGAVVEPFATRLFGRHVGHCAHKLAGLSDVLPGGLRRRSAVVYLMKSAQLHGRGRSGLARPKVKNLDPLALDDKQVCRLDVAVDNAALVRRLQAVRDLNAKRDRLFLRTAGRVK
jgi:hypothetical protein